MNKHPQDICTHEGDDYDRYLGAIVPPLFQNTLFTRKRMQHGYSYSRINNPTVEILEKKMAALEGAQEARVFSSGMAAITALLSSLLQQGDHVVALQSVYSPVVSFLRDEMARFGVTVDFVPNGTPQELADATRPNTVLYYLESPSSNIFKILDLAAIGALAKKQGIVTVTDNTWATPLYQNPLALGIDYVVHSATKYMGGHSDVLAGVVMGDTERMDRLRSRERAFWGSSIDPFAAWLLVRSLRTLPVRMEAHQRNGRAVAQYLAAHPKVRTVLWPGLVSHPGHELARKQMSGYSGLLSFVPDGDDAACMAVAKAMDAFEEGPSWGGFESVFNTPGIHVSPQWMEFFSVPQGLIRLSVGLESEDYLLSSLEKALKTL